MSAGMAYLGRHISLISKAEIRYEGVLYNIDVKEATLALAKVRCFGTENRSTDRPVPQRDEVFEYIMFRGSDIKDLFICDPVDAMSRLKSLNLLNDPAIVKASLPITVGIHVHDNFPKGSSNNFVMERLPSGECRSTTVDQAVQTYDIPNAYGLTKDSKKGVKEFSGLNSYQGCFLYPGNARRTSNGSFRGLLCRSVGGTAPSDRTVDACRLGSLKFDCEYDFEVANATFHKNLTEKELKEKLTVDDRQSIDQDKGGCQEDETGGKDNVDEVDERIVYYDKNKSFFDMISCSASERAAKRPSWKEVQRLNQETFGVSMIESKKRRQLYPLPVVHVCNRGFGQLPVPRRYNSSSKISGPMQNSMKNLRIASQSGSRIMKDQEVEEVWS